MLLASPSGAGIGPSETPAEGLRDRPRSAGPSAKREPRPRSELRHLPRKPWLPGTAARKAPRFTPEPGLQGYEVNGLELVMAA